MPETPAQSAEHVFTVQRHAMLQQIEQLGKAADSSEGTKGVTKEAAILQARAMDQLCFNMIFVTQLVNDRVDHLSNRIDAATKASTASTDALTKWTRRLVWATASLGVAALIAAGLQAFVTITTPPPPPQVITIAKP